MSPELVSYIIGSLLGLIIGVAIMYPIITYLVRRDLEKERRWR
jgi:hypothetical protein